MFEVHLTNIWLYDLQNIDLKKKKYIYKALFLNNKKKNLAKRLT